MRLFSWGANSYGQLAQEQVSSECLLPAECDISQYNWTCEDIKAIVGGAGHSFIIINGQVYGCGNNSVGQLGSKTLPSTVRSFTLLEELSEYKINKISSYWDSSYAITVSGRCIGMGSNSFGQLGHPSLELKFSMGPIDITNELGVDVAVGIRHCALLTRDGYVMTSGDSSKGQLGRPHSGLSQHFEIVPSLKRVKHIACGQYHTLALTEDNRLYGWGSNKFGQLGADPNLIKSFSSPMEILLPADSVDSHTTIHSGWTHAAIYTGSKRIINWGRNSYGQLGSTNRPNEWRPQLMENIDKINALHIGSEHNIAITESSILMSWGWNEHGSCGNGGTENSFQPDQVKVNGHVYLAGTGAAHSFAVIM